MCLQTARQLKLKNLPQCQEISGGAAIELLARDGNPKKFAFPQVMTRIPDCNFSFAGIKFNAKKLIEAEETKLRMYDHRFVFWIMFNIVNLHYRFIFLSYRILSMPFKDLFQIVLCC